MRKHVAAWILILAAGTLLCGCRSMDEDGLWEAGVGENSRSESQEDVPEDGNIQAEQEAAAVAVQGGPYGRISISLPEGWNYELCPIDSDRMVYGLYGIHFYPEGVTEGYVAAAYIDSFGVCGTGLEEKEVTIAGKPASMGIYDKNRYWDFIAFQEEYRGIVALTYSVDSWWDEYGSQISGILDTLSFDPDIREGGAYVYSEESEIMEIGLYVSLKNISSTGADIVFRQYDTDSSDGELIYGDDFVLQVQRDGQWEDVPAVIGNYGFHEIAYKIPADEAAVQTIDWEWLYGKLEPGEYRIGKSILDFVESGNYRKYTIYAQFILN